MINIILNTAPYSSLYVYSLLTVTTPTSLPATMPTRRRLHEALIKAPNERNAKALKALGKILRNASKRHIEHEQDVIKKSTYLAAQNGNVACLELLLAHSAMPNLATTEYGSTPAYIAALYGHAACLKLLLEHGAEPNLATTDYGVTPAYIAAQNGHEACLKLLLEHDANPNFATTDDGITPAFVAAHNGDAACLELLLRHNADLNQATTDKLKLTPAFIATKIGHVDIIKVLLAHQTSDPAQSINDNCQALANIAKEHGHAEVEAMLRQAWKESRKCATCKKPGNTRVCRGCRKVWYCSRACQESNWGDHKAACTLLQLKYHNNDCESTALFGVNSLCPCCGKGIVCTHHGCKESGRRRHKKWCKIGKKMGAKKLDGADQTLGKGGGGGGSGSGGGAAASKQAR